MAKSRSGPDKVRGEVTFDHVVFGYDDETLMRDVNFQAKPGKDGSDCRTDRGRQNNIDEFAAAFL